MPDAAKLLTVGKHKTFLYELVAAFDAAGYEVRVPWKVLNAGHYGTPQFRERLILLGCRKGEKLPNYPAPITGLAGRKQEMDDLTLGPTEVAALFEASTEAGRPGAAIGPHRALL